MEDKPFFSAAEFAGSDSATQPAERKRASTKCDRDFLLNCRRLPARLTAPEAALLLGFQPHDIAVLIRENLLPPLGEPAPNSPRYFAAQLISELAGDVEWLATATRRLSANWRQKNAGEAKRRTTSTQRRRSRYAQ